MKCLLILALAVAAANALAPFHISAKNRVPGRYIVVLEDGVDVQSVIAGFSRDVSAKFDIKRTFRSVLNGFVVEANEVALNLVRKLPGVEFVEEDEIISVQGANLNAGSWGIDRIDQRDLPSNNRMVLNSYGAGSHIYVIDSGINPSHVDFGGRASVAADMLGGDGLDCNGHGTHCAGTAASSTYGVANEASVYGIRTLDCNGSGYKSDSTAALEWVAESGLRPAVASMSLGGSFSLSQNRAVARSRKAGVVVVVAAGNEDADACTKSPASATEAITVGSTDSSDRRSYFSNHGSCVDLFAPGSSITSLSHQTNTGTATMSGTSMACPHVSGIAAVYLSTGYSAEETYSMIVSNASPDKITDDQGTANLLAYAP